LDKGVGIWVAVDAEEEEPLALLVVAVVGVKNRFEKRDDNFEKNDVRDDGPSPEESAPAMPPPTPEAAPNGAAWFRGFRF